MKTEEILNEREKTHGDFEQFSELWADLNQAIREHTQEYICERDYPERTRKHTTAICMILNKIARIIYGDPNFADHWDDIAGYAMLGKGVKTVKDPCSGDIFWYKDGATRPKGDDELKEEDHCSICSKEEGGKLDYIYKPKNAEMKDFKKESEEESFWQRYRDEFETDPAFKELRENVEEAIKFIKENKARDDSKPNVCFDILKAWMNGMMEAKEDGITEYLKKAQYILDKDCSCVTFKGQHHHTCKKFIKPKEECKHNIRPTSNPRDVNNTIFKCIKCNEIV